jgi:hypothetical protein
VCVLNENNLITIMDYKTRSILMQIEKGHM